MGTINLDTQITELVTETVNAVTTLMNAMDSLEVINERLIGMGVDLADYDGIIEGNSGTMHCDAATYTYVLSDVIPVAVVAGLKAYYSGEPTTQGWAALMKVRKS